MSDPDDPRTTRAMTPLESALWRQSRQNSYTLFGSGGSGSDPAKSSVGQLLHKFPRENWLRALALRSNIGYGSLSAQKPVIAWARLGMEAEPNNAFYPLVVAKAMWDLKRRTECDQLLQRAAKCAFFDDGSAALVRLLFSATRKAGVPTWTEQNQIYTESNTYSYYGNSLLDVLATDLVALSVRDKVKGRVVAALSRSRAMMRVALLLRSPPCQSGMWRSGNSWMKSAWCVSLASPVPAQATLARFEAFAVLHNDLEARDLARQCAAREQLISSAMGPQTMLSQDFQSLLLGPHAKWGYLWAFANPCGFILLWFAFYLLVWWWLAALFGWRAIGRESSSIERAGSGTLVIAFALVSALALYSWFFEAEDRPVAARTPSGQMEVLAALWFLCCSTPPLLLALWCALHTRWNNREALRLPARAQIEMRLSPLESWLLGQATGAFFFAFLLLGLAFAGIWAFLRWNALTGYDWLRAVFPGVSTRVIDPFFTSLDSGSLPLYAALSLLPLTALWIVSWRFVVGQDKRAIFHSGLRAWKEALGCALTATVWLYLALMLGAHFSGEKLKARLEVAAMKGEGALVPGFSTPTKGSQGK